MSPWLSLIVMLVGTGVALCGAAIVLMAWGLLVPPRMTDARAVLMLKRLSPGDLELEFSDANFVVRDEQTGSPLKIAGWWIPAREFSTRTVVIVHGYSDAKVGGIAWAPMFHRMGWNVLAIDLRAHGESGGRFSTAGYWEMHDLAQVLDQLKSERQRETQTLVMFGVSLGAACALGAVQGRDDVTAIILEGPFANYELAVAAHSALLGAPGGWMQRATLKLAQWLAGADFAAVKPVDLIPSTPCPVMIVHALDDFSVTPATEAALRGSLDVHGHERDVFYAVGGAGHVVCLNCEPQGYEGKVQAFLDAMLGGAVAPGAVAWVRG
jgi:pimeloyl-ACP methyl ester carboxylesterase